MGSEPDFTRRDELEKYRLTHGNQSLWNILHELDPTYADMLHVNNYTYIIRGIEVWEKTGKSKLEAAHGHKLIYPTLFITPYTDSVENRKSLYGHIDLRVSQMFAT
jgi:tRNA dimethylallyltransferase